MSTRIEIFLIASLLLGFGASFPSVASAQAQGLEPRAVTAKESSSFYGLTEGQVTSRFGKPDEVTTKSNGGAEWSYGRSVIFFSGGKVMAWSDAGELQQREKIALLKSDKTKRDDSLSEEWANPWTPPKKGPKLERAIEEFIEE